MRATLIIFFALLTRTLSENEPCNMDMSVELKDRSYNGVVYNDGEFFVDNATGLERGCFCMRETCVRKCCPFGQEYDFKLKNCANQSRPFEPTVWSNNREIKGFDLLENFHFIFGKQKCALDMGEFRIAAKHAKLDFYLKRDGFLYVSFPGNDPPWLLYGPEKYCIDTFVNDFKSDAETGTTLNALICFPGGEDTDVHYALSSSCMLISCFFILLTVAVYAWLPELRNLHGMVLMAYLLSFFVGFLFLATMQIMLSRKEITAMLCLVFTFIIYYALLAAFFWLNVMCFDIWWTFSGKRSSSGQSSVRRRFLRYCLYAFGLPSLFTGVLAGLEFSDIPHSNPYLLPSLRTHGCFLRDWSKFLYLYCPIIALCILNLTFFVLTAIKIYKIKSQTQKVLQSKESSTHEKDKQRFSLYIKLFAVMGVNWILEVISSLYPEGDYLWQFTDAYNVLVGLIIFIIFVCKKKTIKMIQKRFKDKLRRSNSEIGEMRDFNHKNLARWQSSQTIRASIDTIKTVLNTDLENKSVIRL